MDEVVKMQIEASFVKFLVVWVSILLVSSLLICVLVAHLVRKRSSPLLADRVH